MVMNIERPLTPEEKKEITPLNQIDHKRIFRELLSQHEQKCVEGLVPFCRRCSYIEYDRVARIKELDYLERGMQIIGTENELLDLARKFDFSPYTGANHFTLRGMTKINEPVMINLNKVPQHTSNWAHLECERFKHPISMQIPIDKWAEWEKSLKQKQAQSSIPK